MTTIKTTANELAKAYFNGKKWARSKRCNRPTPVQTDTGIILIITILEKKNWTSKAQSITFSTTADRCNMKTARIEIGHVFGTWATNYAEVSYRGKRKFFIMENENRQVLCDKTIAWAKQNGYTHFNVTMFS